MAGTLIVPQIIVQNGPAVAPNFVAGATQMELPNTGEVLLHLKATGAVTLTATNQTTSDAAVANPNKTVAMTTGQERIVQFSPGLFNMNNGRVQLGFDTPANVTVAAYSLA